MKAAFSYIRFSTPDQARGDSFRRQSKRAEDWAEKNGYQIVKTWEDLGVSGFKGRNAKSGRFAEFLRAAEAGELPKDSVLLLENLDRMSRHEPDEALSLFLHVIHLGVGIVTLTDDKLYTKQTLKKDTMQLFGTLMVMMRANEESKLKGERVAASWSRKRVAARERSVPLSDRIPRWIVSHRDPSGQRTFTVHDKRADIVRRIFAETAQGFGRRRIVKKLNQEDETKPFLPKSGLQPSTVAKLIRGRTVLGEYQPHRRNDAGERVPDGEPIKNYYPAVIDEGLWLRANAAGSTSAEKVRLAPAGGSRQPDSGAGVLRLR